MRDLVLDSILGDTTTPRSEQAEARGLIGRIYKDLYVNANDPASPRRQDDLRRAIEAYHDVYQTDPDQFLWQGINTVALLDRAEKDGILSTLGFPDTLKLSIAQRIATSLASRDLEYWDRATAIENAMALGDARGAYDHFCYYGIDPRVDAFKCTPFVASSRKCGD